MRWILGSLLMISMALPRVSQANPTREFISSCTYGVMAGSLVGVATLAFTNKPGDNLNKVARGASLGLYTGILLGVYVVYIVPGLEPEDELDPVAAIDKIPFTLNPILTDDYRLDGAEASWTVHRF